MANTTNFNWETPDDTDLVKDGAAAIRTLGSAIDTSLVDLKGGTTGQILSKTSNTDMDFTWIANDQGDITGITATSPLTGGGTSGAITVGIQDGTTAQKGAVQLENSTSSTSTTTAAVPASVKSAYDLANGAIAKSIVDAKGDLILGTANDTVSRLAVGATSGHVLTVDSAETTGVKWAAVPSGGGMTQLGSTTTLSGTSTTISSLDFTGYNYAYIEVSGIVGGSPSLRLNNISTTDYGIYINGVWGTGGTEQKNNYNRIPMDWSGVVGVKTTGGKNVYAIVISNPNSTLMKNFQLSGSFEGDSSADFVSFFQQGNARGVSSAITSLVFSTGGSFTAGSVKVFGVK